MGVFVNGIAIKGEGEFNILEAEEAEETAKEISLKRSCPVLSAYIYDGDYWGYTLYLNGEIQNEFATMPDYFEDSEDVVSRYTANVPLLSQSFSVSAKRIEKYLCHWTDAMLEGEDFAYEEDEFPYGDAWQMVDFLKALGFSYPEEEVSNQLSNPMCGQLPTLRQILENNLPANACEETAEEDSLIDMLPSAFSPDYLWNLLEDKKIKEFQLTDKTPREIIDFVLEYCVKVKLSEKDFVCQRLNVLAGFCAYWMKKESSMKKGSAWSFLDGATYEPVCLNYEKPTDIYLLRARAAVTAFSKHHRAIRDLKRLIELDSDNIELYQAEIRKWEREEKRYLERLQCRLSKSSD